MAGEADCLPPSGGGSASAATVGGEDISKLLPLSLVRSKLVPSAPSRRRAAIDFLFDFGGSSWVAYGASSLVVISHFPSPIPECGNLVGPFFRQVIEPIALGAADGLDVNAVSWCPTRPSDGEVAAALGNSILFYAPQPDQDSGSFCWKITTCIRQSSIIEAIEWTGSGEGIVAAGIEVSLWRRNGTSWVMAWKSVADVPQVLVSATWSADGLISSSAGFLLNSGEKGAHNSPFLSKEDCRQVSVYHGDGKSGVTKFQLLHPQPVSMIRWRPSSPIKLTMGTSHSWRDMLLTCCFDGAVRLWSEVDNGRSRKASKEINDHSTVRSFQVVAVIEMDQCLNGMLGRDIFVDWAVDLAFVISKCEGGSYSLSSSTVKHANISPCEWIIGIGPANSVAFWSVHCLDDSTPFRSPRVSLWKKQNLLNLQSGNSSKYESIQPVERPILIKMIAMRNQLFGPPDACSLLQLLPGNSMNWWHFYSPLNNDSSQESFPQVNKEKCLSHFASGVLNLDGHTETILQLALHPHSYEVELAASLDSSGSVFFWSLSTNLNSTISLQKFIHPNWQLLGKIRSQDLSSDFKYLALVWAPLVLDGKPLLLLGYSGGIDGFLIEVSDEEKNILYHKMFNVPFVGHCHFEGLPDHMFATALASCSDSFLLSGVWINSCRILSWKVALQSEDLSGTMCVFSSDSKSILIPEKENNGTFHERRRYSAAVYPILWNFPDSQSSKTVTCVSVISLDHSLINMEQFAVCGNGSCEDSFSIMATGCSDGTLQLWKVPSGDSTFSTSDRIPCNLVGLFVAQNGPVNAVSLSKCGGRIATMSNGGHNSKSILHIWMPISLIGGGGFLLEDVLSIDDKVVALRWLTIGNGRLLLGVCTPNELRIYSERRSDICLVEYDKSSDTHTWCCIALAHIYHHCHDFLWGPKLTPVLLHEKQITVLSEWLSETDYNHSGFGSSISIANTGDNVQITGEFKQHDCMESGMSSNVFFSGVFMKNNDVGGRIRYHNLLDIVDKLCGSLEFYHPQALIQNLYTGNWKRAYAVLRHIADSLKPLKASMIALECSSSGRFCNISRIGLLNYLEGTTTADSGTNKLQWGQGNTYGSFTFEKINLQFGEDASKSREPLCSSPKSEIMSLVDTLENSLDLISLTKIERIQILTILDILLELSNTSFTCVYESLDEPGRRFWVAVKFQHLHFLRKVGRIVSADHYVVESWMVACAFQSDCQENLLSSILSTEPSWLEMRNLGMGFWFTNASQLRPRMEKLARAQYIKRKNPKDCALLYLALNRLQVLVGLFKISKDEKDKVLFGFLSRNFQEEKNKAAALKNAYVLMARHEVELAVAFFLLGGDHFSAVTVCAKNLGDEQLAIVICRLLEGFGGSLEQQLISKILLPNAIEKGDYWLCSLFEWTLGNYSLSVKRLFEHSMISTIDDTATCSSIPFKDPHICPYLMIIASKQSLKNEIGEFMASVLSKFAAMMNTYSLGRFGLPLEALDCLAAASTLQSSDEERSFDIENHTIFGKFINLFNATSVTQTWLRGDFIYLETNIKLRLAMQYISSLLQELPTWAFRNPETFAQGLNPYNSLRDQEHQIGEFREKLKVVLLTFERRYSLKLIDIANMVLVFACQSGLLFLGYHLLQGIICSQHDVHSQHIPGRCISCPALICLLLKASSEVFCMYSRYAVCCHLTDSKLKLLFGRSSTAGDSGDWFLPRDLCLRSLMYSLKIIRQLLKFYDHLLFAERLSLRTSSLLEFMEYMMCFSHMLFGRNLTKLVRMVLQIYAISFNNHASMEVMLAELMKLLHQGLEINSGDAANGCAGIRQVCSNKTKAKQVECLALLIPTDERWQLIETSLWMLVDSFANQQLSTFLPGKNLETENSMTPQKQLPTVVAKLAMASIKYVSSSSTKLLACFLIGKASKGLPVATFDWLEESDQRESSSLQCLIDKGACFTPMSSNSEEDNEALLQKIWEISVKPNDIYHCFLNEKVYSFTYHSKKAPSSWKDISNVDLEEHGSGASYHTSKGNFKITAPNSMESLFVKREADIDAFLVTSRRDLNPKFENPAFASSKDIVKRNGELLEAICCNSINEQQLAVTSNRKGLLFYNWKMEPDFKEKALHIWSEVAWPLNGWAGSESKPVATHVSTGDGIGSKSGERLGLHGATRGFGLMARPGRDLTGGGAFGIPGYAGMGASGFGWVEQFEFEEFVDAPATAENVRSRALCSHPSRPFLLAGVDNTRIYLWEFGMDRATATYGVLPAANVPTPHKFSSLSALKFDQSGHRFASAALDGMVCNWQVDVGGKGDIHPTESAHLFNNHASDVAYVAASGSILATAGFNSNGVNILVWDTLAPPAASQASLVCHEGGARSLSVFDNGLGTGSISPLIITGGKNGGLGLHDFRYIATGRGKQYQRPRDLDIRSSNGYDDPKAIENANGMIWYIPKAHLGSITKIATIPCSTMFLTGSKDGNVKLWDAKNAKLVFHWQKIHERHTFLQPNSRNIGAVVRAAVTDIQVFSHGFLTCGGDGSVKLVQLK